MFYYLVWVRSNRYHSKEPLTYYYDQKLDSGTFVKVPLQNIMVNGFISSSTPAPRFKTKPISEVIELPPLSLSLIQLAKWLIQYYPSPLGMVSQQFMPSKIPTIINDQKLPKQVSDAELPALTTEQQAVLEAIDHPDTYLIHGNTGSGKTRIYIELTKKTITNGKSAIILTPEISLTSQLFSSFYEQFSNRVILIHSKQTPKERQDAWLRCLLAKEPLVIIGPRSALFSPLNNLGLIVIDEAHENAYKQEQSPHYQTVRVASVLSKLTVATLIIGSATPSIVDYYIAKEKNKPILRLKSLAKTNTNKSKVLLVDIKDRSNFTSSNSLSNQLIESIKQSLSKGEQSLLFLNRRGTSRLILCQNCGWEALCPNCNLPLTYHADHHQLRCHTCGYKQDSVPSICPSCDNDSIIYRTIGTKAIEAEISKIFLTAKIARFDTDNKKADTIDYNYQQIKGGSIDILIGTQLLAKGFDLPRLSTVGVLQADTSLYLPDFSSQERTYQLITQVLGRVNRGHRDSRAIIQTYSPNSKLLVQAINQDYEAFYHDELTDRKLFKFPPYYQLLKLCCRRSSPKNAETAATKLKEELLKLGLKVQIDGPAPAFHEKFQDKYEWQLVVKSTDRKNLTDLLVHIPANWSYDIDPINLL